VFCVSSAASSFLLPQAVSTPSSITAVSRIASAFFMFLFTFFFKNRSERNIKAAMVTHSRSHDSNQQHRAAKKSRRG
jgi:hypothetical protein